MANEFEAKVEVDTSGAAKDLKNVDAAVEKLDTTLNSLDKTLNRFQGTLSKTTAALQQATRAQRDSDSAADKSAAATLKLATARERDSRAALNAARTESVARREREATARANESAANSFQGVTGAIRGYQGAAHDADQSTLALSGSMSNTRYLLYDIGATYRAISAALLTIPVATTAVAASFQKDFAQVERTTVGTTANMGDLQKALMDLTTEIPLSFTEISKIASLGAQLGVQAENLASFTEVVAKFSAATGVSAEEAGSAFGRIGSAFNLDAGQYEKLGSAIAKVGVSSAATETEIIAITQQLAPLASLAGFSAQEVVGLSGALASMRIRPELARGAFQSTIFKITEAVENGGAKLQAYATIMGKTQEQVAKQFKTDPSGFFRDYITGIGKAMEGGQSFSSILDDLGVKEKRERQFILAMANQYGFLGDQIDLAKKAYSEGTFLDESSAKVFETFAANLQKLGNALANLGATLGSKSLGVLAQLVEVMKDGTVAITDFIAQNPELGRILSVLMGFGAVVGVFYAIRTAMAFVMAAMVGFQQVAGKAALQTTFSLKGLAAQAAVTALVTKGATSSMAADFVRMNGTLAAGSARVITNSEGVVTSIAKQGGALRGLGSTMLSFVGGPIGVLVGALSVLTLGYAEAEGASKSLAQQIQGVDTGDEKFKLAAEGLSKIEANFGNVGLAFDAYGKNVGEVASDLGIKFEDLVNISLKGKQGAADLEEIANRVAKAKGYANGAAFFASADTDAAKLRFVINETSRLGNQMESAAKSAKTADNAMKNVGIDTTGVKEFGDESEQTSSKIDTLTKNINDAAAAAFGLNNAAAASNDAMYKLGQSLQASNDLSTDTSGGRDNLENAQNAVTKYALALAQAQSQGKITAEQAAADYMSYLDGLYNALVNKGVDPGQAAAFVEQAKGVMQGAANSGTPVSVPVTVDGGQAQAKGAEVSQQVQYGIDTLPPVARVEADTQPAETDIGTLAQFAIIALGTPFVAPVTADTKAGVENVTGFAGYTESTLKDPFIAPVTADTSSGQQNLLNFASWARDLLNSISIAIAVVTGNINNANQAAANAGRNDRIVDAPVPVKQAPTPTAARVDIPAPQVDSRPNAALRNLGAGYDDAAAKAAKAGAAGKKAGKDAADGISDAAKAVNDYADRLKTGLTAAYDQQHGLQKATDDYYTALNSINKKRKDDLKTIDELIAKQKELNNARQGDLVAARKAEIEAGISRKYGEVDRAKDYEQQAEEARLAAAEKQKNIDTAREEQRELENGIYALDGYSQAAIDNRNAIRDLESKMIDMISAYAATGASQQQVAAYAANLTRTFGIQVSQMGYNQGSVNALIGTTQRYIDTIYRVPTRVHTDSSNDFGAGAREAGGLAGAINAIPRSVNTTVKVDADTTSYVRKWMEANVAVREHYLRNIPQTGPGGTSAGVPIPMYAGGVVPRFASGGLVPGTPPSDPKRDNIYAKVDGKGMAMIRSGEFIQPQPAVDYYGLDFMEAIRNMTLPRYNVGGPVGVPTAGRGSGSESVQLVELTAENIAAILRLADRPVNLFSDAELLASTVNEGNKILATKGVK